MSHMHVQISVSYMLCGFLVCMVVLMIPLMLCATCYYMHGVYRRNNYMKSICIHKMAGSKFRT